MLSDIGVTATRESPMIRSVVRFIQALRRRGERESALSAATSPVEKLTRRIAELEHAVLGYRTAADDLRKTQADLARAQRMAKIGNWRWSVLQNELIEGSDAYAEIHGVDPTEIHGLMDDQIERVVHREDRERVERAFRTFDESGTGYEIEYRIVRPDGEVRHVREIGENIVDDAGRIVEQIGTVQDVTQLKCAEAALREAHDELEQRVRVRTTELQAANVALREEVAEREGAEAQREERELLLRSMARISKIGYAVWDDLERKYVNVSEEFAQIVGLTVEEFEDRYPTVIEDYEAIHPDDRERYRAYDEAYKENPEIVEIEFRMIDPEGEIVYVRELMQPILDDTGRLIQSIITNQDITDQKRTEDQLRQAQKMEAVGQLTGGIAHDFNNLLAVILGNLELVEDEIRNGSQASEWLQTAIAAAERGAGLTQRLLAFSRKQALRPAAVDANALVQGMLDLLRRTIGERIEIELVRDAGLWQCLADPNQLENAILNLAINARDAMLAGGKLTITTSNARIDDDYALAQPDVRPGQYVLVAVSDTGSGMSAVVQQHAFEPFYTTKDVGRGSGLGLSMVYGFTKQSGGHVSVYSEVSVGTTIRLFLPRFSGEEVAKAAGADPVEFGKADGAVVLVVEDDRDLRALVIRMLRSLGYGVIEANSGAPALEILRSASEVDLLLTDVVLPEQMSGSALVEAALRVRPDLRVLYMSGYTEDAIVHQRRLVAGDPFLQKPFRRLDVARAVQKALARSRSRR